MKWIDDISPLAIAVAVLTVLAAGFGITLSIYRSGRDYGQRVTVEHDRPRKVRHALGGRVPAGRRRVWLGRRGGAGRVDGHGVREAGLCAGRLREPDGLRTVGGGRQGTARVRACVSFCGGVAGGCAPRMDARAL